MKLYYAPHACSLAIRILLHELNLSCEFIQVDLKTKKIETGDDFLIINPKGQVPALWLDQQEVLTENLVIQQYLADKTNAFSLLPPLSEFKRYRVLEWLNFIATDLHKNFGPFFNPNLDLQLKEDLFKPILKNKLDYVEHQLNGAQYLMGDQFTLPDTYLFVILTWLPLAKLDLSNWPNLLRYFQNLKQRDSVKQALREERSEG